MRSVPFTDEDTMPIPETPNAFYARVAYSDDDTHPLVIELKELDHCVSPTGARRIAANLIKVAHALLEGADAIDAEREAGVTAEASVGTEITGN